MAKYSLAGKRVYKEGWGFGKGYRQQPSKIECNFDADEKMR